MPYAQFENKTLNKQRLLVRSAGRRARLQSRGCGEQRPRLRLVPAGAMWAAGQEEGKRGPGMVPASRTRRKETPQNPSRRACSAGGGAVPAVPCAAATAFLGRSRLPPAPSWPCGAARRRARKTGAAGAVSHPRGCNSSCCLTGSPGQGC